ncbi:MAG: hypothetical protein DMF40_07740 [Verrucomicrobia bacterium]|nr:MAG: hypothetical protein DMF40_07740 [Verrucomicrobiota bacterium]
MGVALASWIGGSTETPVRDTLYLIANIISTYSAPGEGKKQGILKTTELMCMGARYYEPITRPLQNLDEVQFEKA